MKQTWGTEWDTDLFLFVVVVQHLLALVGRVQHFITFISFVHLNVFGTVVQSGNGGGMGGDVQRRRRREKGGGCRLR